MTAAIATPLARTSRDRLGRDAADRRDRQVRRARDREHAGDSDRGAGVVFRPGGVDGADAEIVGVAGRARFGLRCRSSGR